MIFLIFDRCQSGLSKQQAKSNICLKAIIERFPNEILNLSEQATQEGDHIQDSSNEIWGRGAESSQPHFLDFDFSRKTHTD